MNPDVQNAFEKAQSIRTKAHAPYSNFFVSAALKLKNGPVVTGFNIENASYGATVCAERTAVFAALTQHQIKEFDFLVVITEKGQSPCGMCLQVLTEFCSSDFPIYLATPEKIIDSLTLSDFLPRAFEF